MNLDLNGYRLHLVFSPTDMRNGYRTLSAIASSEHHGLFLNLETMKVNPIGV